MAGGYGGMDLYTVTQTDGVWSNPQNLGATVNTMGNELFPTLRSDDSLYFSSNAHQTLGGLDILYSVYRNGDWNAPTHLPYPVNTQFDDFGMAFTNDGTTGFFSSDRSGRDGIYSFISNDDFFNLSGLVTRKFDGSPLEGATITLTNLTDGTEEVFITDELGMFENVLLPGKDYRVKVEKEGFFNVNETVSTRNPDADRNVALNIELLDLSNPDVTDNGGTGGGENGNGDDVGTGNDRLPKGVNANNPYQVPNIFWDYDKADIREDARPYLDYVAKLLKDNPQLKVEVSSHCDSRGGDFYNDQLSDRRARAVTEYLVKKGVKRSMLLSKGYGKRKLLNRCSDGVNCSEEEHQVNRRTEFKVLN
jgi:outer membrane protein OmpA-like peptidoglycan-associated protein